MASDGIGPVVIGWDRMGSDGIGSDRIGGDEAF
mgnify:CR=1 FL=1